MFVIPSKDYYEFKSFSKIKIEDIENEFKKIVGKDFKVLELIYSNKEENKDYGIDTDRYVLYKNNIVNLEKCVSIDFIQKSIKATNNSIKQIFHGKFYPTDIKKPETMIYFDYFDSSNLSLINTDSIISKISFISIIYGIVTKINNNNMKSFIEKQLLNAIKEIAYKKLGYLIPFRKYICKFICYIFKKIKDRFFKK